MRLANDSPFGLQASVWTKDARKGEQLARRIEAGAVTVNDASQLRGARAADGRLEGVRPRHAPRRGRHPQVHEEPVAARHELRADEEGPAHDALHAAAHQASGADAEAPSTGAASGRGVQAPAVEPPPTLRGRRRIGCAQPSRRVCRAACPGGRARRTPPRSRPIDDYAYDHATRAARSTRRPAPSRWWTGSSRTRAACRGGSCAARSWGKNSASPARRGPRGRLAPRRRQRGRPPRGAPPDRPLAGHRQRRQRARARPPDGHPGDHLELPLVVVRLRRDGPVLRLLHRARQAPQARELHEAHKDHIHFGLSRAGARKRTTFWAR